MEWELKIASDVQNTLQPHLFPDVRGLDIYGTVEQGRFVGGDYCDFLKLADDVLLVVMADVSGKGVPAALIMSQVRASTQLLASPNTDLEDLIQRVNTLLYQSTRKKDFVTLFAATIDVTRHTVTYVNAGHPPPLIHLNGHIRSLAQRTIPLGLFPSLPELAIATEVFAPGSVFVSYTDGVLERMNTQGEQYGLERLRDYVIAEFRLDAQPLARQLIEEVKKFGQGREPDDDVSVAVVKYFTSMS
jgi:sigma-B regulation protein RsbU (phosphoserine phosphatase)